MNLLYNIGIQLFGLLLRVASLKNQKASSWLKGRKGLLKAIKKEVLNVENIVWVHCASLGEFEQGRPLIEEIKRNYPEKKVLLTFYSPSGFEVQKNYKGADYIYYLPLDSYFNARRFVRYVNPETVFFIKYEYWFNYLSQLKKRNIPIYFVSAIFREKQLFFKWYGGWYRKMLKKATHFFVQSDLSAKLLDQIGISNYTIAGDTRFDRVIHIMENVKPLKIVESFINGDDVIVAGSSWKAEDALLNQYLRNKPKVKLILAPHEVSEENIERIMNMFGDKAILYSKVTNGIASEKQVLVIDCYGMLTSLYQYGKIAFIGGGFGVGLHNILEAATFGMPILFGPNFERFKEARELVAQNAAFSVNNIEEFNTVMNHLFNDSELIKRISEKSASYVAQNVGATQKVLDRVFNS
jgi:3-deoxy-D-manno-octulosonic-acid transferase